jgi:class 3 adenylate cyclase
MSMPSMSPRDVRLEALRKTVKPEVFAVIEKLVLEAPDLLLCRINALELAGEHGLDERETIDAFLHASKIGLFDMSWNLLCPGCGGVLDALASLKSLSSDQYRCRLCAGSYEPNLDERVEVSFTLSPSVRKISAHTPDSLNFYDYCRHMYFSNALRLPRGDAWQKEMSQCTLEAEEVAPDSRIILSLQIPQVFVIVFDPVTHGATFLDVKGEPTKERQELTILYNASGVSTSEVVLRPGPLRLTLENKTSRRILPGLFVADDRFHELFHKKQGFLTAKRLFTNQTFRELFRADTLAADQRLKLTSLTVLFTDLKGSTALYERVGDLVAYEIVQAHFHVLGDVVRTNSGAIVKTIGDAVMATFPTPDYGLRAALEMRDAMDRLNQGRRHEDLTLKIGMHEGPCLAVTLNDRLDYFGQTVNIAARVQGLADSRSIFATEPVVKNPLVADILQQRQLVPSPQRASLKGIKDELTVYEIG